MEEGGEISLDLVSPTELRGGFEVRQDDFYRIHLQNDEAIWSPASDEYLIEALVDQPPTVTFTKPGRDRKVTNLEEVFSEVKAEDDHGLRRLSLLYSVNGGDQQTVALKAPRYSTEVTASHTFYLEEYDLVPGDFISYFAEASDAVTTARTDIYFFEVQPYDREFIQSQQAGGGAADGAGGGESLFLSRLQKEIIAATFNLQREKKSLPVDEFKENVQTVALMQQQLQQQAQTIIERIGRRGALSQQPMFQKMVEHLNQAKEFMGEAELLLTQNNPDDALKPEQQSFQQLLRAESLFKEIQISMGGSPGGRGSSTAEELADMVDLELDRQKNQYETLQQSRQQSQDQALDDAARKLKELAQRQQQEAERRRKAQQNGSGSGSASQQALLEEIEKLTRQLERLSRQKRDQRLEEVTRNLKQAARDLRRSQSSSNPSEAQAQSQRALERLQQAQNSLNRQRGEQLSDSIRALAETSEDLLERQREVVDRVRNLETRQAQGQIDQEFMQEFNSVRRDKFELQEEVQRLESKLHQGAKRISGSQPEASKKLKAAGHGIRDQRIPEKMSESSELLRQGWIDLAREREESVEEDLQQLAENVMDAQDAVGEGGQLNPQEKAEEALGQIAGLVEDLESLRQRAMAQQGEEGEEGREGESQGQEGREVGEGEGQQGQEGKEGGEGEGKQGQEGKEGRQGEGQGQGQQGRGGEGQGRQGQAQNSGVLGSGRPNPQQARREWQERVEDAERIRDLLRRSDPMTARSVAALARQMRELDASRILDDPEEVERLKSQIIDGFRELELALYQNLKEEGEQLRLGHEDEIPPELRERVEEYYRALAETKRKK
jgi:hypothetical protein